MKVCYCVATTDLEGGAKSLLDLLKTVNKNKKIKPYVILTKKHKKLENILNNLNIDYVVIYHGTDCKTKNKVKQLIKVIINKVAKKRIKKFIMDNEIDILHNNSVLSLVGMEAALELKVPYICHVREVIEAGLNLEMINYEKLYYLMNKSYKCIYISEFVKKRYEHFISSNNQMVLYDGIDIEKYIMNKSLEKECFNKLLLVGRIEKGKCQLDAVMAIRELIKDKLNCHLTLIGTVGDKEYYNEIKEYIQQNYLEDNIEIMPYSNDLRKLRNENRIALICSSNEGLGRVTVEAMLSRQLVIGASAGATEELIKNDYNGYLYELHNYKQLASKIKNINQKQAKEIIDNSFKFAVKNFDNDRQNNVIIDIYNKLEDENEDKN